jgi:acyl-CoA thioesterase-1
VRKSLSLFFVTLAWAVVAAACSEAGSRLPATEPVVSVERDLTPAAPATDGRPEVVFLGDSLTAGLGLDPSRSFPSLIQQRMDERGMGFTVVNAGVSGDTSAGGLRRLDWSLQGNARVLVLALGANDGLRGLPVNALKKNLAAIIERAQRAGLTVVLAGMEAPPNNGADYTDRFRTVYTDLARRYGVALIPFLLQGVAGDPSLNQADGIHPNPEGARRIADTVWSTLEPVLTSASGAR